MLGHIKGGKRSEMVVVGFILYITKTCTFTRRDVLSASIDKLIGQYIITDNNRILSQIIIVTLRL